MRRVPIFVLIYWMIFLMPSLSLAEGTTTDIQQWEDAANHGSVFAPFQLGYSYQHGQGVKKNMVEAAKWYSLGADRGDLQAALVLAGMYLRGEGVQTNEGKAIDLYVTIGKSN